MKKHPHLRSSTRTAALLLAGSIAALLVPRLSAQNTIEYSEGQNNATAYSTSAPNSPTTLYYSDNGAGATQSGILSGTGAVIIDVAGLDDVGTLTLSAANTSTGTTTVNSGTLALGNVNALQNSTLITGGDGVTFTVAGTNTYNLGGLAGAEYLSIGGNSISVGANNADTTFTGLLVGSGGLTKVGAGTLTRSGSGSFSGVTTVSAGTLALGGTGAMFNSTLDTGASGAQAVTFTVAGTNTYEIGGLTGADDLAIGGNTIRVRNHASSTTYSGILSGSGGLTKKFGTGTLTLTGTNTYSGNSTIRGGTLKLHLSGSISNSAAIIVGDAGSTGTHLDVTTKTGGLTIGLAQTLKGIGQIDGNTTILGTHAPGNSPGLQTFNGGLAYSTGAMLNWELTSQVSTDTSGVRGVFFDAMDVLSPGALSIATGVTSNLIFNGAGSAVDWNHAFWDSNHSWLVYDDALAPTLASGAIFDTINVSLDSLGATLSGGSFAWSAVGNDVFLNFTAPPVVPVPEPTGVAVGLLCVGVAALRRRRRAG